MGIIKSIAKQLLYISIVLAVGQVPLGTNSLGGHFLTNVNEGTRWMGNTLVNAKFMAGVPIPEFINRWLKKEAEPVKKKRHAELDSLVEEQISKADREAMLQLLKE